MTRGPTNSVDRVGQCLSEVLVANLGRVGLTNDLATRLLDGYDALGVRMTNLAFEIGPPCISRTVFSRPR